MHAQAFHLTEPAQLFEYAQHLRLDMPRFTAEMDDEIFLQRVRAHQRNGVASGVRGTPTFFVNGHLVEVSYWLYVLLDAVDAALKDATHRSNASSKG